MKYDKDDVKFISSCNEATKINFSQAVADTIRSLNWAVHLMSKPQVEDRDLEDARELLRRLSTERLHSMAESIDDRIEYLKELCDDELENENNN